MTFHANLRDRARAFLREDDGANTILGLYFFLMSTVVGGLAIDFNKLTTEHTRLQVVADSVAHAALQVRQSDSADAARARAMEVVDTMIPASRYGDALTAADIQFGIWDAGTGEFTVDENSREAVRVVDAESDTRGNPIDNLLLHMVGQDSFNAVRSAVFKAETDPCYLEGVLAEGEIRISTDAADDGEGEKDDNKGDENDSEDHGDDHGSDSKDGHGDDHGDGKSGDRGSDHGSKHGDDHGQDHSRDDGKSDHKDHSDKESKDDGKDHDSKNKDDRSHDRASDDGEGDHKDHADNESKKQGKDHGSKKEDDRSHDRASDDGEGDHKDHADDESKKQGKDHGNDHASGNDLVGDCIIPNDYVSLEHHDRIPGYLEELEAVEGEDLPDYVEISVPTYISEKEVSPDDLREHAVNIMSCHGNGQIKLRTGHYENMVIVTECRVKFDNDVDLENVVVATSSTASNSMIAAADLRIGADDGCRDGGGAVLLTQGGFHAASRLEIHGGQIVAGGDIRYAAKARGFEGASLVAGGDIDGVGEIEIGTCNGEGSDGNYVGKLVRMAD